MLLLLECLWKTEAVNPFICTDKMKISGTRIVEMNYFYIRVFLGHSRQVFLFFLDKKINNENKHKNLFI